MNSKIYLSIIAFAIGIIVLLMIRNEKQTSTIQNNNSLIKTYQEERDSLQGEMKKSELLLKKGLQREDSIAKAIARTDSFNLILLKKISKYAKPDYSHLSYDSAGMLLADRAKRFRSKH